MQISGKLALITGASSGIGEETAKQLAARGARVLLLARRGAELERVAGQIRAAGGAADPFMIDINDADAVAALAARITAEIGVPDILINNAGGGRWLPIAQTTPEQAREMIGAPYLSAFYVTRAFIEPMLARRSGMIVNVCSIASRMLVPLPAAAYVAARWAMHGFTNALRAELHGTGIRVMLYTSGTVRTPYWDKNPDTTARLGDLMDTPFTISTEQAAAALVRGIERDKHTVIPPLAMWLTYTLYGWMQDWMDAFTARYVLRR